MAIKFHGDKHAFIAQLNAFFGTSDKGRQSGNCYRYVLQHDGTKYNVNLFGNGTVNIQPQATPEIYSGVEKALSESNNVAQYKTGGKKIFIVHGHDHNAKNALENILFRWELKPYAIQDEDSKGRTIIEFLESEIKNHSLGIVLLTADDLGYAVNAGEESKQRRARQNVILELGMLIGALGRDKCIIVRQTDVESPSDIDGLIYLSFDRDVNEIKDKLKQKLESILGIALK